MEIVSNYKDLLDGVATLLLICYGLIKSSIDIWSVYNYIGRILIEKSCIMEAAAVFI